MSLLKCVLNEKKKAQKIGRKEKSWGKLPYCVRVNINHSQLLHMKGNWNSSKTCLNLKMMLRKIIKHKILCRYYMQYGIVYIFLNILLRNAHIGG